MYVRTPHSTVRTSVLVLPVHTVRGKASRSLFGMDFLSSVDGTRTRDSRQATAGEDKKLASKVDEEIHFVCVELLPGQNYRYSGVQVLHVTRTYDTVPVQ